MKPNFATGENNFHAVEANFAASSASSASKTPHVSLAFQAPHRILRRRVIDIIGCHAEDDE